MSPECSTITEDPAVKAKLEAVGLGGYVQSLPTRFDKQICAEYLANVDKATKRSTVTMPDGHTQQVFITLEDIRAALLLPINPRSLKPTQTSPKETLWPLMTKQDSNSGEVIFDLIKDPVE